MATCAVLAGARSFAAIAEWAADAFPEVLQALDGKPLRGSGGPHGSARPLMTAIDYDAGVVLGQVTVDSKTNEIPLFSLLCDHIDNLDGAVVTADALHCQPPTPTTSSPNAAPTTC